MNERIRKAVRQMAAYVPGEQPTDKRILKLNTNENPYPPSPQTLRVLREMDAESLALYPDPVCTRLRERLAELHEVSVENIIVGNGSDELLALCLRAFVEEGAAVGYFEPSYSLYPVLTAIHGAAAQPTLLPDDFGWTPPTGDNLSLFFLTNPNAPTSLLFPGDEVELFCSGFGGVVVIDEAYVDFATEDHMNLTRSLSNVIVTRTLSKAYSLAGIRLGYAVASDDLIAAMMKIKDSYNVNELTQRVALAALEDQPYFKENLARLIATRENVAAHLRDLDFEVYPSATNFLWIKPKNREADAVFEVLRERHILVRYFPGPCTGAYLRISVGTEEQMKHFLNVLREVV